MTTVSIHDGTDVLTKSKITIKADSNLSDINADDFDGLYIPGGTAGAEALRDDDKVIDIIKSYNNDGKIIAAICAGPIVLNRAGVLVDRSATSFPSLKDDLDKLGTYVDDEIVVTDDNITTSRGAASTIYLAMRLVELIKGKDAVDELKEGTQQVSVEKYYDFSYEINNGE